MTIDFEISNPHCHRVWRGIAPALIAISLISCAPTVPVFRTPVPRALGQDFPAVNALGSPGAVGDQEDYAGPEGEITLEIALAAALLHNPSLTAFSWEVRAKEAEALQAGLLPNPELEAEVENFAGTGDLAGFSGFEATAAVSQLVELGGKRAKRLALAGRERDLAAWDYETKRIDVITETAKAFVAVLTSQEQLTLATDLVVVAEEVLQSVERRVKAGAVSPVEAYRARVELETSRIERVQAEREREMANQRLAKAWGSTAPRFSRAKGILDVLAEIPGRDWLLKHIAENPELARWSTELEQRRAAYDLAEAQGVPDVTIGAGVRYLNDARSPAFLAQVGLPLPLFDRNQGASRAAEHRMAGASSERRAALIRVQTEVAVTHEALLAAQAEIVALDEHALPEAEKAFEAAQQAHQSGRMRLTDVLDTKRSLFELRSRRFQALSRYHNAVADLERLLGAPLGKTTDKAERP